MCGIAGFIDNLNHRNKFDPNKIIADMTSSLIHRGPDDEGHWHDSNLGVTLGHRRLSIVDLSFHGHQPMMSPSKRYVMVFNGEIYNHLSLRKDLEKSKADIVWRGHSDTETLLACIDTWGITQSIQQCSGMFAIAIMDKLDNSLHLIRDRIGEKPLYYGVQKGVFLFASELKAIKKHPAFFGIIDRNSLALQLRYSYIPTPFSIYKGIKKLEPGTILKINLADLGDDVESIVKPKPYWSLEYIAKNAINNIYRGSPNEAISDLEGLLNSSVQEQMRADVPLGVFLSGGIDSSLIASIMQSQSLKPVKTFSIGFNEEAYNEAIYAKEIAKHIGTEHTEMYVSSNEARDVITKLPQLYDEPFSDSSQIPTYLLSKLTSESVTVSLSGDAGDELFGGYNRYLLTNKILNTTKFMPVSMKKFISLSMTTISPKVWDKILYQFFRMSLSGDKIHKLASILPLNSSEKMYYNLISHWHNSESVVIGSSGITAPVMDMNNHLDLGSDEQNMMYLDTISYLPDDILTKVDRAAMSVSLETRIPFLNHRVVEFSYQLPLSLKIHNGESKWILRQLLDKYIPRNLVERPKMGFGVPIDSWLRDPLRDWAESLLDESRLIEEGFFYVEPIRKKWKEHLSGKKNWQYLLWDVLMFQAWLEDQ